MRPIQVLLAMIEPVLGRFQVQIERVFWNAAEPGQASFGIAPEALYAVDLVTLSRELLLPMLHLEMLVEAQVHEFMVAARHRCGAPGGGLLCRGWPLAAPLLLALGIMPPIDHIATLEQAEDDRCPRSRGPPCCLCVVARNTTSQAPDLFQGQLLLTCAANNRRMRRRSHSKFDRNSGRAGPLRPVRSRAKHRTGYRNWPSLNLERWNNSSFQPAMTADDCYPGAGSLRGATPGPFRACSLKLKSPAGARSRRPRITQSSVGQSLKSLSWNRRPRRCSAQGRHSRSGPAMCLIQRSSCTMKSFGSGCSQIAATRNLNMLQIAATYSRPAYWAF